MQNPSHRNAKRPLRWVQVLIVVVTLAAVAVTVFLGNRAYNRNRQMALNQFNEQQLILARSAATGIESYFSEISTVLRAAAKIPSIQQMTPDCIEYMQYMYRGSFLPVTSIRRLDENGVLRFIYPFKGWRGKFVGRDYSGVAYFQRTMDAGRIIVSGTIINEQGDMRIRVAVPVYLNHDETDAGSFKGVLVVSFTLNTITKAFISPIVSGKTGYAWLINQDGILLAHYESEFVGRNAFKVRAEKDPTQSFEAINQIQQKMMAGKEGTGRYVLGWHRGQTGKIEKLVAYTPIYAGDDIWFVAVCAPINEVDRIMRAVGRDALYLFVFVILILITTGAFLAISTYRWSYSLEREVESRTRELQENEERFRLAAESASDLIYEWDIATDHLEWFGDIDGVLGYEPGELEKTIETWMALIHPDDQDQLATVVKHHRESGDPMYVEYSIRRKDGAWLYWTDRGMAILDDKGKPCKLIGVCTDITERKRLEAQLLQAQKMEAIGTMAGGIAHDFNNILQAVSGYVQLLLMKKEANETDRNYLNQIDKSIRRAAKLIEQLLLFSRKVKSELRPVDINQEVARVESLLERTIPGMISIETHPADDIKTINADPIQLEQIIMNLAVNARDAMPDGGRLVIETENTVLDEEYCKTHLGPTPGEYVLLAVSDTGCGMDSETLRHIFEPFYTSKEVGKGTGLGLATVYGIVKGHGGYIMCYSEPGHGTTFRIYFPVLEEAEVTEQVPEREEVGEVHGDETILLVDDEESILDIGCDILEQYGYTIITAESGEEAIEVYKSERERIDLVILDVGMPGMGGHRCLEELLRINPDVKVVIASGYSASGKVKETLEAGAVGFIGKPYRLVDMLQKVRDVLDLGS